MEYGQIVNFNGVLGKVVTDEGKFYFNPANGGHYSCSRLEEITDETAIPATFQEKIRYIREDFPWGNIIEIHHIGEYQIIEHMDKGEVRFCPYINFSSCNSSHSSIDTALIGAITKNSIEANEARYATTFILRMLQKPKW